MNHMHNLKVISIISSNNFGHVLGEKNHIHIMFDFLNEQSMEYK